MLLLESTSDLVQVITGGAQAVKVHASFVDVNGTVITPGRLNTAISSATTTTAVASPGSGVSRNVKFLSILNTDATTADTITVQHTDGTTVIILFKMSLPAGWSVNFVDGAGWQVFDTNGNIQQSSIAGTGQLLKTTYLVSTQTFTTQTSTRTVIFEMVGGGGAGGGVTVTNANGVGGGGGAGAYLKKSSVAVTGSTGYAFAAGAAGAGSSGAVGGNGGSSTIVIGATTYTAPGGTGGALGTSSTTAPLQTPGGAGGAVPTNGDINATGSPGGVGVVAVAGTNGSSGDGGSTLFGGGGNPVVASGNGSAAGGNGGGGSGGLSLAALARTGGAGTIGAILIYEYS